MPDKTDAERLEAHARAIRILRKQVQELTARVNEMTSATPSTETAPGETEQPAPGTYVPKPYCLACGKPKPPGRTELTCKPCGTERNKIIRTKGATRPVIVECGNCGARKTASIQLLCPPCSESFRASKTE